MSRRFRWIGVFIMMIGMWAGMGQAGVREYRAETVRFFGGGGGLGPTVGWLLPRLTRLDAEITGIGLVHFGDRQPFPMVGGQAYRYVSEEVRVGVALSGGTRRTSGIVGEIGKEVSLSAGIGGATAEYAYPYGDAEVSVGGFIGVSRVRLHVRRVAGGIRRWGEIWGDYRGDAAPTGDASATLSATVLVWEPSVGVRYRVVKAVWMGASAGYTGLLIPRGGWAQEGIKVFDSPRVGMGGPVLRVGLFVDGGP